MRLKVECHYKDMKSFSYKTKIMRTVFYKQFSNKIQT